jgi:hypothetical protein
MWVFGKMIRLIRKYVTINLELITHLYLPK